MNRGMRDHGKIEESVEWKNRKGEAAEVGQHVRRVQKARFIHRAISIGTIRRDQNHCSHKACEKKYASAFSCVARVNRCNHHLQRTRSRSSGWKYGVQGS